MIDGARAAIARGRIDDAGILIAADPQLDALNSRAGGRIGAPLAIPSIAAIARLARRLRIAVFRAVTATAGDADLDLWVEAEPDGRGGVDIAVTGWTRRGARPPLFDSGARAERDIDRATADWRWEVDDRLRVTMLSDAAAGPIGGDPQQFVGMPLTGLFTFGEDADGASPVLEAFAAHHAFDGQIASIRKAPATRFKLSGVPLMDGRGRFAGFAGAAAIVDDLPPSSVAATTNANTDADAFAARLDEALRKPLDRIIANAESLRAQSEGPLRAEYTGYATDIASAGRHLLSLVDDLVDLQAIERHDFRPDADALDLADIARRAAGLLGVRAANVDVRIVRPAETDQLAAIGEFRRVLQILVNLVGNAVRYAPPGSTVSITTTTLDGRSAIIVADAGKGVAPADQARIFGKFERVDTSEPGGTGLGLYIARRLARAMGGDLVLESAAGEGARFTLTLPAG